MNDFKASGGGYASTPLGNYIVEDASEGSSNHI